tara:strand:+ start:254 stop:1309 length:1056 start_codon:yes stop_codon:yes gene_type:complete
MKNKILFLLFLLSILLVFQSKNLFYKFLDSRYHELLHYKIAKNISKEYEENIIHGLNMWMLNNFITKNIPERSMPVLDKNSYNRLVDGYAVCDGSADTYSKIAEFLNFKTYLIPLYLSNKYEVSNHTVLTISENKISDIEKIRNNRLIIDPVYNIAFHNKTGSYANFIEVCENRIQDSQSEYLKEMKYSLYKSHCYLKNIWGENTPLKNDKLIKRILYFILDKSSESFFDENIYKYLINKYGDRNYIMLARNFHLLGNKKQARKYYEKVIYNNKNIKISFFNNASIDENFKNKKKLALEELSLSEYAKLFLVLLNNEENKTIQENPFKNDEILYNLYETYKSQKINYMLSI